ncbi:hypothetical protein GCM10009753_58520 [Streptantibioticus ferralitis]
MDVVHPRCAGIDIGKADMKVCVRVPGAGGRRHSEVRTFSTMAAGVFEARDWLSGLGVTLVAMEATGSYWKPVFYVLEQDFETWLLNARHMRNLPGRKTDVADSVWIAQLVEHGLVRPSFVPPEPIRHLRDLTRYRAELTAERTREAVRLERLLEDSGVKVPVVASHILTKSVRAMLEALIEESVILRCWPIWPGARCAGRSGSCGKPWLATGVPTTASWPGSCSTASMLALPRSRR